MDFSISTDPPPLDGPGSTTSFLTLRDYFQNWVSVQLNCAPELTGCPKNLKSWEFEWNENKRCTFFMNIEHYMACYLFDARIFQVSCKEIPGLSSQLCYRGPPPSATYSRWNILSWSASGKFPFHGTQVRSFTCLVSLSGGHSSFLILLKLLDLLRLLGGFLFSCHMDLSNLIHGFL